jgi:hypothetical protein
MKTNFIAGQRKKNSLKACYVRSLRIWFFCCNTILHKHQTVLTSYLYKSDRNAFRIFKKNVKLNNILKTIDIISTWFIGATPQTHWSLIVNLCVISTKCSGRSLAFASFGSRRLILQIVTVSPVLMNNVNWNFR